MTPYPTDRLKMYSHMSSPFLPGSEKAFPVYSAIVAVTSSQPAAPSLASSCPVIASPFSWENSSLCLPSSERTAAEISADLRLLVLSKGTLQYSHFMHCPLGPIF